MIYSLRHKQRSKVNVSTTDDSLILNASQLIDMQFFFLHHFISGTSASTKKPQTVKITFPLAFDKQPQNTHIHLLPARSRRHQWERDS